MEGWQRSKFTEYFDFACSVGYCMGRSSSFALEARFW